MATTGDDRSEEQRIVSEARIIAVAEPLFRRMWLAEWDRMGSNMRTEENVERHARFIAWGYRQEERSITLRKRVLGWCTFFITLTGFLFEAIKFYLELRK